MADVKMVVFIHPPQMASSLTAASMLVQANIPIYTVSKILGHTQLKTTERYSHLADDSLLAAADTAANAMANVWATSKSSPV